MKYKKLVKENIIKICAENGIEINSYIINIFSKNSTNENYWCNINVNRLESNWLLVLNDYINEILYCFEIPKNTLSIKDVILRKDKPWLVDLQIKYNDTNFEDTRSHICFRKWKIKEICYKKNNNAKLVNNKYEDIKISLSDEFKEYLENKNYSLGTINSYSSALNSICSEEDIPLHELKRNINKIVELYSPSGIKVKIGNKGHNTYINALRRFQEFINKTKNLKSNPTITPENKKQQNIPMSKGNKLIDEIKKLANEGFEQAKKEHNYYYTHIFKEIKQKLGLL